MNAQAICAKCNGTGTEVMPGKGARACSCRRKGKVVDLQSYRTAHTKHDAHRVEQEVEGVMTFFAAHSPDFITDAVVDAIGEACNHTGMEAPTYEHDAETRATLKNLFSKTKMLRLRIERSNADMKAETTAEKWYPRQGLNLRPFAPEANALIH